MGARGRKSKAELTLVRNRAEVLVLRRPEAPDDLSDEAAAEWREVVASCDADHFSRATYSILAAYCRHAVATRRIDQLIKNMEEGDEWSVGMYDKLLVMHERESRALASLAVRLGIASVSRAAQKIGGSKSYDKPWEK
jgi:phage terminase small subunit